MLGKIEGRRRRGEREENELFGWHQNLLDMSLSKMWEMVKDWETWSAAVHGVTRVRHD